MKRYLILIIAIAVSISMSPPLLASAQEGLPRWEPAVCPIEVPDDAAIECGYLIVPEAYDTPEKKQIRLPVIIIHSVAANPASDPILYTEGGPGYSSLSAVWWFASSAYVEDRDLIILEQRGNRYAQPDLSCDPAVWGEEAKGETGCLDSLWERGIDLTNYTMKSIVADINALRQTLDYEAWNLYGSSFSTRLMQLSMHLYPEGIRSVVLQSTSSLTETRYQHDPEHAVRALDVMFDDCADDPECAQAYPSLKNEFYELFNKLNDDPVPFEFIDPESGDPFTMSVDGYRLLSWMVEDAYYGPAWPPHMTAYLPLLIHQVNEGNTDLLYAWLRNQLIRQSTESDFSWGMFFSVNCQEDASSVTPGAMAAQAAVYPELDGYVRQARELEICDIWDLPASPPLITGPLTSDIPTLILAGGYDPITPPGWGMSVAENLTNSFYFEFPAAGHSLDRDNPCAEQIKAAFFNDPTTAPDASCMADVPYPEFVLPEEVYIAPGIYHSMYDVSLGDPERGEPMLEAIAASSIIIFLAELVFLVIGGVLLLMRRRRIDNNSKRWAFAGHLMAGLASLIGFATGLIITQVNNHFLNTDPRMLYFGLSTSYPPSLFLGLLAMAMALLAVGLTVVATTAWIRRHWSLRMRAFFTLVTLSAVGFTIMLARWDLVTLLF